MKLRSQSIAKRRLVISSGLTLCLAAGIAIAVGFNETPDQRGISMKPAVSLQATGAPTPTCSGTDQCNGQALSDRRANFAPAQPIDNSKQRPAISDIVDRAKHFAQVTDDKRSALPAKWELTTVGDFNKRQGLGKDPLIDDTRPVWVVTIHGPVTESTPPGTPALTKDVYTLVVDAPTGSLITEAIGLDYFAS